MQTGTSQENLNLKKEGLILMELCIRRFDELTLAELYEILAARVSVFVVEQNCPYQELDGLDEQSIHLYFRDETGILAYLRVIDPRDGSTDAVIGRVLSKKRRCGLADRLVAEGIRVASEELHARRIRLGAQVYARKLYEKHGFCACSEEYLEDGIRHVEMEYFPGE